MAFTGGAFGACYFILALWDKWETSPVYVSVESTSYPIAYVPFPAVTVCSVNKIQENRLDKALEAMAEDEDEDYGTIPKWKIQDILESIVRFDEVDTSDDYLENPWDLKSSDLLKIIKSVG